MLRYEKATACGRRNLTLEHGNQDHEHASSEPTKHAADEEHGQVAGTGLQAAGQDSNRSGKQERAFAAKTITGPSADKSAEEATAGKGTVDTSDDGIGIGIP